MIIGNYGDPWWVFVPLFVGLLAARAFRRWRRRDSSKSGETTMASSLPPVSVTKRKYPARARDNAFRCALTAVISLIGGIVVITDGRTGAGIGLLACAAVLAVLAVLYWRKRKVVGPN